MSEQNAQNDKNEKEKIDYTLSQEKAIEAEDGDILVSAAAGSGKTMVLTHRIMKNLCRKEDPELLGDLLVVTFTKPAAAELVEKIAELIREEIRNTDDEEIKDRLRRELLCLPAAQISTIHSYCLDLIRENYRKLDLSGSFRIAEENEAKFLLLEVCKSVVDSFYEEEQKTGNRDFSEFCAVFYPTRDDKIENDLSERYTKLLNYAEGIDYLNESTLMKCSEEAVVEHCRETILGKFGHILTHYEKVIAHAYDYVSGDQQLMKARGDCLSATLEQLNKCEAALAIGWDAVKDCLSNLYFGKSGRLTNSELKTPEFEFFDQKRKDCSEELKAFAQTYFSKIGGDPVKDVEKTRKLVATLLRVLRRVDDRFTAEKRRRSMIDFSDMERMTLTLLKDPDVRSAQKKRFKRIYIDEYQDVNPLQDRIFTEISDRNRFMVGDIKQSIYGFRGAAPDLFARYRAEFPEHIDGIPQEKAKIFLSDNFRCDKSVVNYSNALFARLFPVGSGIVDYVPEKDELNYAKKEEKDLHFPVEIHLFAHQNAQDGLEKQAEYAADRIAELIAGGVKPEKIAILLRSTSKSAKYFADALTKRGILSTGGNKTSFFNKPHVLLTLSMLRVIDNPRNDISLAAVLKSPVSGVRADTLLKIASYPGKTLFERLMHYQSAENDPVTARFLDRLSSLRPMQKSCASHTILRALYEETDLYASAASEGVAKDELSAFDTLYDLARRFEAHSFRGLHAFLHYVDLLIESDGNADDESKGSDTPNAVHIVSIHHSKGLQYPVCFVANVEKGFNTKDLESDIIDDEHFGPALRLRDETGLVKYETLLRISQRHVHEEKCADEEARLLYVALTRAQNRLILLGSCKDPDKDVALGSMNSGYFDNYACLECGSFLNWILSCREALNLCQMTVHGGEEIPEESAVAAPAEAAGIGEDRLKEAKECAEQILRRIDLTEKRLKALSEINSLPTKLSVSTLKPDLFDGSEGEIRESAEKADVQGKIPRFLLGEKAASAAEKGTATHLFMQFCNFERVGEYGVSAEIAALVSERFIEKETADLIEKDRLEYFFKSELFREMLASPKLYREERFNVLLRADTFTEDPERKAALAGKKVLVQGVADCFFIDDKGGVCLVDYKTDHFGRNLSEDEIRKELVSRYETQLSYYAKALREILGLPVDRALLWSFALNSAVEVSV